MEKKFQVFVSSTYTDLIEERQCAVNAILDAGHIPIGMELFKSGKPTIDVIKEWIDKADIYLLILGGRYGSLGAPDGKGYTEFEYNYAYSKGMPIIFVVLTEDFLEKKAEKLGKEKVFEQKSTEKYDDFRKVIVNNITKFVCNLDQITSVIHSELSAIVAEDIGKKSSPLVGYIRNPIRTFSTIEEVDVYLGEMIKNAKKSIDDLTWRDLYRNDPMRNQNQYKNAQEQFLEIIEKKVKDNIKYTHIFTFPDNKEERIDRVRELIKYETYSCGFYDSYTRNFPKLHFIIIDKEEVIFASSNYKYNLCAIREPELVGILTTYYEECWYKCKKIKDYRGINEKYLQEAYDDFAQKKKFFRFLKYLSSIREKT